MMIMMIDDDDYDDDYDYDDDDDDDNEDSKCIKSLKFSRCASILFPRHLKPDLHETNYFVRSEFFAASARKICAEVEIRKFAANSQRIRGE